MEIVKFTNTATNQKETLTPLQSGKIKMYSCGPTVYGLIHVGNLRAGLVSDLIYRFLKRVGFEVTFVRNYTDVDDKIIKRAKEENSTPEAIAKKYIQEVEKDYAAAGMLEPTYKTTVTDHMVEIIAMIENIIQNGKAYVANDGEVIFEISKFENYGKLSQKNMDDLIAGHRVEVSDKKRNPLDFTLWKPAKAGEPFWESPWGRGRPGWHIECSAMAFKWLGAQMDIHHGGEDLVFPHHENEIAQTESATGIRPYVGTWVHSAFLNIKKEKMSKSLGNIISARDFLTQYHGELARMMLLGVHYRSIIDFDDDLVENALTAWGRIYEAKAKAIELLQQKASLPDSLGESLWGEFLAELQKTQVDFISHLANDLNTPLALGSVFKLIREFNRVSQNAHAKRTATASLAAQQFILFLETELGGILGVGRLSPQVVSEHVLRIKAQRQATEGRVQLSEEEIKQFIQARMEARQNKNFAEADRIRKELQEKGVVIKDSPQGTTWEYL